MDALEVDNRYYLLTDLSTINSFRERVPTVTIFDESLNIIKKIELFGGSVRIMPIKYFYVNNVFYLLGLAMDDNQKAKPFLAKFDKDFNLLQPITLYALDNPLEYSYNFAMMNKKNEFLYLIWDNSYPKENRLLHIDTNGNVLSDLSLPYYIPNGSIAETDNFYFIEYKKYLLKLNKEPLKLVDTLYPIKHENDVPDGSLIAINNQLIRTNTYYSAYDICSVDSISDIKRSVEFLDTNMNTNTRLEFGESCSNNMSAFLLGLSYIDPDSIYYAYETVMFESEVYQGSTISIANFSQNGQLNFNYMLNIPEDTLPRFIYGCQALSDGGVLVYGESRNFLEEYSSYGFILKYHPYRTDLTSSIKTFPLTTQVNVYPNPVQQTLYIQSSDEIEHIAVYDISGRELLTAKVSSSVDVSSLANGIYLVKVKTKAGETVKKIIKQ